MKLNNIINKIKSINSNIKFVGSFNDNNQKTGYWEKHYPNGKIKWKGNFKNGLKDGYWEIYYSNGELYRKGHYINGKTDGYWELYYYNGKIFSKGGFKNGEYYEIK
jgi:antitoxin component YwqK of YwqJK toxin-antitoxin module